MDSDQTQTREEETMLILRSHRLHRTVVSSMFGLVLFFLLLSLPLSAQITPSGDAYTDTAVSRTKFGGSQVLELQGPTRTVYIQFDLSSIPAGYTSANVTKATLKLYVNLVTTPGSFNVDFINGAWAESTITANLSPALGTTIAASIPLSSTNVHDYVLIDVTAAVGAWLDGAQANDGLALVANSPLNARLDSKENQSTSHPPELDIVLTGSTGAGTITGVTTASGSGLSGGGTSGNLNLSLIKTCSNGQVLQWNGSNWICSGAGSGTITGVTAGTDLVGGGTSGNVTLNVDLTKVPQLNFPNSFIGNQSVTGNVAASGTVSGGVVNASTSFNLGGSAFAFGDFGLSNDFLGFFAGNATMTGTVNTATGNGALHFNTTGGANTATGYVALAANTIGSNNTATGYYALQANTTGYYNSAFGSNSLLNNTAGGYNSAVGLSALSNNTTGVYNNAFGYNAGPDSNSPNLHNTTAIGANAIVSENNALVLGGTGAYAVKVGIGTATPTSTLDVRGTANFTDLVTFASGQTFPGAGGGTITGVTAGTDLVGGGTSGNVTLNVDTTKVVSGVIAGTGLIGGGTGGVPTLNLDTTKVPQLNVANTFIGDQNVAGNVAATGTVAGGAVNASTSFNLGGTPFAFGSFANANAFLGFAGNSTITGQGNTAIGWSALSSDGLGWENTANGAFVLFSNTTGLDNTASGFEALRLNTTGSSNTASGGYALAANTTGIENTADGRDSLQNNNGDDNTASGVQSLYRNLSGSFNTALGSRTLTANITGSNNTGLGYLAGPDVRSPSLTNSTAIGAFATVTEDNALVLGSINGVNNATADTKVGIGTTAPAYTLDVHGTGNFTGLVTFSPEQQFPGAGGGTITGVIAGTDLIGGGTSGNVTLNVDTSKVVTAVIAGNDLVGGGIGGVQVLNLDTTKVPQLNVPNYFQASQIVAGDLTSLGTVTGQQVNAESNFSLAGYPFAFGSLVLNNAFLGFAGNFAATGTENTAVGDLALAAVDTGTSNTAIGTRALNSNAAGNGNTASGAAAMQLNTIGSYNTADGSGVLAQNTEGMFNTASGTNALYLNTTGIRNTAAGNNALFQNRTGSYNTAVGFLAGPDFNTPNLTNSTAIGAYAVVNQDNSLVLGSINGVNDATADTNVGIGTTTPTNLLTLGQNKGPAIADGWSTYSSRRWKTNIHSLDNALAKVTQLRGVSYDLKESGKHEIGVIAEEVGDVVPEVVSFESNGKDARGVDYSRLTAVLIEAVKQQQAQIREQGRQILLQEHTIAVLRTQLRLRAAKEALVESRLAQLERGGPEPAKSVSALLQKPAAQNRSGSKDRLTYK
jgi:hypothetical protein